jgi:uncharacterized protein (DUF486 family)
VGAAPIEVDGHIFVAMIPRWLTSLALLIGSNVFMTTAWYNHLRKGQWSMLAAILISWCVALPEYCLQVPANRLGHKDFGGPYSAPQLKIIQEAVTIGVFIVFSITVLNERPKWTDLVGFGLIFLGVVVSMLGPQFFGSGAH